VYKRIGIYYTLYRYVYARESGRGRECVSEFVEMTTAAITIIIVVYIRAKWVRWCGEGVAGVIVGGSRRRVQ